MSSLPLWLLGGVLLAGMLMRLPIGFSMIAAGIAYFIAKRQDIGLWMAGMNARAGAAPSHSLKPSAPK